MAVAILAQSSQSDSGSDGRVFFAIAVAVLAQAAQMQSESGSDGAAASAGCLRDDPWAVDSDGDHDHACAVLVPFEPAPAPAPLAAVARRRPSVEGGAVGHLGRRAIRRNVEGCESDRARSSGWDPAAFCTRFSSGLLATC